MDDRGGFPGSLIVEGNVTSTLKDLHPAVKDWSVFEQCARSVAAGPRHSTRSVHGWGGHIHIRRNFRIQKIDQTCLPTKRLWVPPQDHCGDIEGPIRPDLSWHPQKCEPSQKTN